MLRKPNVSNQLRLSREMKRLYEQLHYVSDLGCGLATGDWPLINIYKTTDGAIVEALVPGIDAAEINLAVNGKVLTLDSDIIPRAVREDDRIFHRTVEFPFGINLSESSVHSFNGLLRIKLARELSDEGEGSTEGKTESRIVSNFVSTVEETSVKVIPIQCASIAFANSSEKQSSFNPRTEIFETDTDYLMVVEMPGVPNHLVEVFLNNSALTIVGTKTHFLLQNLQLVYSEFQTASYLRKMSLFDNVDQNRITALLKDGVLRIRLPKRSNFECIAKSH